MDLYLSRIYDGLANAGVSNAYLVGCALRSIGQREPNPHARMALDLAVQADDMGDCNPYHNANHLREVTVNMIALCALNARRTRAAVLSPKHLTTAIALAVSHDLGHDGSTNNRVMLGASGNAVIGPGGSAVTMNIPFLLEDNAILAINLAGGRAGVPETDLRQMRAAILTTDENTGYEILDAVLDPQADPARRTALLRLRPELPALRDPGVLHLATMLRDADLMASCAISADETDRQTARLERERGMPEGALRGHGTEHFLVVIARGKFLSPEGQQFQPCLNHLRDLNRARLRLPDPAAWTLGQIERLRETASKHHGTPRRRAA